MVLVVNQEPKIHALLDRYLDMHRRISDRQIMSEVRFLTVSES